MIVMGARGYNKDGTGGEIAIYLNDAAITPFLLLKPSRFSYRLFNSWVKRYPRKDKPRDFSKRPLELGTWK